MYLDFYQLKSPPFQSTPDPTLLFGSASHKAALDALAAGIATRQGFVVITGPPGVGKTTVVHAYLTRLAPPQRTTVVLWQARLTFRELLVLLARRFEVPVQMDALGAMLTQLHQRFRHEAQQGCPVALLIDEAQDLPLETLAQLPLLAPLTASQESCLAIGLVGQPALLRHLRRRRLRRVAQRIGSYATLRPLTKAESLAYIRRRVAMVALPGGPLFTQEALRALVHHAHGVPRDLNRLCTAGLQAGYWAQQQPITANLVQQVLARSPGGKPFPLGRLGFAATAGFVLAASFLWVAPFHPRPPALDRSPAARVQPSSEAVQSTSAPSPRRALSQAPGEGDLHLGPWEAGERQSLELPLALPLTGVPPTLPARPTSRAPTPAPAPPRQRPPRLGAAPPAATTPSSPGGSPTALVPPSPPPPPEGYRLRRRIYCDNLASGVLQGSTDLQVMSPLSCEEAKHILLVWEQQKDHCAVVDPTLHESHHKAKAWIGTPSCPMP